MGLKQGPNILYIHLNVTNPYCMISYILHYPNAPIKLASKMIYIIPLYVNFRSYPSLTLPLA